MLVELVNVSREDIPTKNGKGTYGQLTVTYRSNGKIAEKKLMSFSNPAVFKHFEKMANGESVEVTTVKNANGFWDWTAIGQATEAKQVAQQPNTNTNRVTGSNYETKEERALRQRYIIRQSSISSAVAALTVGSKSSLDVGDVITYAKKLEDYVFSEDGLADLVSMTDDIPE